MSLATIFKNILPGTTATPPQQIPTNNPMNNPKPAGTQQTQQTEPNGVIPEGGNKGQEPSPGDKFKELWNPTPVDPNEKSEESTALSPEKMLEAASKVDFTKVLDQALLAKIAAGGDEAVAALTQILNKQSQTVYGQSVVVTNKLIEKAVGDAEQRFQKLLPGMVKNHTAGEDLQAENPAYSDPAVAPIFKAVKQQVIEKFPNASSREVSALTKEYMETLVTKVGGVLPNQEGKNTNTTKTGEDFDWLNYLSN